MELALLLGNVSIAVAVLIAWARWELLSVLVCWVVAFWKAQLVNQK